MGNGGIHVHIMYILPLDEPTGNMLWFCARITVSVFIKTFPFVVCGFQNKSVGLGLSVYFNQKYISLRQKIQRSSTTALKYNALIPDSRQGYVFF